MSAPLDPLAAGSLIPPGTPSAVLDAARQAEPLAAQELHHLRSEADAGRTEAADTVVACASLLDPAGRTAAVCAA